MFNEEINKSKPVEPEKSIMYTQDIRDYLIEREGIYIYDAGFSEAVAMRKAQEDLYRLEKGERK